MIDNLDLMNSAGLRLAEPPKKSKLEDLETEHKAHDEVEEELVLKACAIALVSNFPLRASGIATISCYFTDELFEYKNKNMTEGKKLSTRFTSRRGIAFL